MKADLTRRSFDPLKHFSRVLMQQGRVQLDADWNEQADILLHLIRQLAVATFGPSGSPDGGFVPSLLAGTTTDLELAPGTCYVDGILCELDAKPVPVTSWSGKTIVVQRWTVDASGWLAGQHVRLSFDAGTSGSAPAPLVAAIVTADYATLTLTLDTDLSTLTNVAAMRVQHVVTYLTQPDLPSPPPLPTTAPFQLYLDVWERLATPLEDPSIRELALNGADTADRTRVVCQVKCMRPDNWDGKTCLTPAQIAIGVGVTNHGLLRACTTQPQTPTDPCTASPSAGYRGVENQLYRVEINTGSNDPSGNAPSFKWSRDNGSVVFPVLGVAVSGATTTVRLANLGRDERFGLAEGDYVEVQDDASVLNQLPGQMLQIQSIDTGSLSVVLAGALASSAGSQPQLHPLMRRWDYQAGDPAQGGLTLGKDGAALIVPGALSEGASAWLTLEDGIQILFEGGSNVTWRCGDYWLIPARVVTGDVIWPQEKVVDAQGNSVTNPAALPPDGVTHHYAPLAIQTGNAKVPFTYCITVKTL
ncbi:DUF6519 domain-containing protein [Paraburkholderia guartelaensis]|uniref:DUF6519 domain-containing protein n=1 Tax=Paraburkholderia guartelaensis TaxID=2546446 RepID=UPI002AB7F0F5|nr:DUF6519 domain-containing protein [Paraburkholderia guartelaensis]